MEMSIFQSMADKWRAEIVARTEAAAFTGGAISGKYLANLDSRGLGPAGRFYIGRRCVYPTHLFVDWLSKRSSWKSK